MAEEDAQEFSSLLKSNKGDKFLLLFTLLKEGNLQDKEIENKLDANPGSYYTLKSRLLEKVQNYLADKVPLLENTEIVKNLNNIPQLIYSMPRETAITLLLKMEKECAEHDRPRSMAFIYHALKQLHIHSSKYYDFDQKYNKHLAYSVAIQKAENILSMFVKILGEYLLSRDKKHLDLFPIYKMQMQTNASLYPSHHLKVFENLLNIQYALFLPSSAATGNDRPVDDLLIETEKIFSENSKEPPYKYLQSAIDFFWLEFYMHHGMEKKAVVFYENVSHNAVVFLRNNFIAFPSAFLDSKIAWHLISGSEENLLEECRILSAKYAPYKEDVPGYVNYEKFRAVSFYYSGKCSDAVSVLNELFKEVSFLHLQHAEIELRLFLVICCLLAGKHEVAEIILTNVQRKLREMKNTEYENAAVLAKMLAFPFKLKEKIEKEKMRMLRDRFLQLNKGVAKMLDFLRMDDAFIARLLKSVK